MLSVWALARPVDFCKAACHDSGRECSHSLALLPSPAARRKRETGASELTGGNVEDVHGLSA